MKDNFVAKNARIHRGGFHSPDKYQRGEKTVNNWDALTEYFSDIDEHIWNSSFLGDVDTEKLEEENNWKEYQEELSNGNED